METNRFGDIERADNFAHLVLDEIRLLIPQSDIRVLEPVADMVPATGHAGGGIGQFELDDTVWPIYALSTDLTPLSDRPDAYRIAVLMKHGQQAYGVLCKQVSMIERGRIALHPVPPCMSRRPSPLLALALYGDEVLCVSSASALDRSLRELADA
jgi:hypothetical protein